MNGKKKFYYIIILGMLSAIGPFSIDTYLPAFADIATDLHTTIPNIQLSLSSFFIGICFGQMLYGPLLDRFGRKKPLYVGLSIYILASAGCALVKTADGLIALRFVQAIGGCAGMVASRAMVRDLFPVKDNAKVFSMLMLVIGVSPIVAPTLGGYITAAWGWHTIFILLTVMVVLILTAVHFTLPESRQPDTNISLKPAPIVRGFWNVLREPQFYTYAFTGAIAASGLYAYISGTPYVFMKIYQVSEKTYGLIFAGLASGLIISSQINSLLLKKYKSEQIIPVALFFQMLSGAVLFFGSKYELLNIYGFIAASFTFLSCQGFTFPNSSALSMAPFSKNAGSASALMGGIQMGIGALASALVSVFSDGTALPMTGVMACCALSAFLVLMLGKRIISYKAKLEDVEMESVDMITNS